MSLSAAHTAAKYLDLDEMIDAAERREELRLLDSLMRVGKERYDVRDRLTQKQVLDREVNDQIDVWAGL